MRMELQVAASSFTLAFRNEQISDWLIDMIPRVLSVMLSNAYPVPIKFYAGVATTL